MAATDLVRQIQFYRAELGRDDSRRPLTFDATNALTRIAGLSFTDADDGRYMPLGAGRFLSAWPETSSSKYSRVRVGVTRRSGLPLVDEQGQLTGLTIGKDAGLVELTHVVFFPNNIVGVEYNHYGARAARVADYLASKGGANYEALAFRTLLLDDQLQRLRDLTEVFGATFRIEASWLQQVENGKSSLVDAIRNLASLPDADVIEISVTKTRPRGPRRNELSGLQAVKEMCKALFEDERGVEGVHKARVSGVKRNNGCAAAGDAGDALTDDDVDLLQSVLKYPHKVVAVDARSKAVDSRSVYRAIEELYEHHSDEIERARSVEID